jgi:hypothetical protein
MNSRRKTCFFKYPDVFIPTYLASVLDETDEVVDILVNTVAGGNHPDEFRFQLKTQSGNADRSLTHWLSGFSRFSS